MTFHRFVFGWVFRVLIDVVLPILFGLAIGSLFRLQN